MEHAFSINLCRGLVKKGMLLVEAPAIVGSLNISPSVLLLNFATAFFSSVVPKPSYPSVCRLQLVLQATNTGVGTVGTRLPFFPSDQLLLEGRSRGGSGISRRARIAW